jgi:hypothetical protein
LVNVQKKENGMHEATQLSGYLTREDQYFNALEAFLRTSAVYLDVEGQLPWEEISEVHHDPVPSHEMA